MSHFNDTTQLTVTKWRSNTLRMVKKKQKKLQRAKFTN